ncbi:MAG: phage baseplate assembly protein V [Pseudomonadota bacterium]
MRESVLRRLLDPIRRRLRLMITRAVGRAVDPSALLQMLQVEALPGELLDRVEHVEGYGRTAHPPAGYEALLASLGGNREHTVAIAAFHRQYRVKNLAAGEQALYDDLGNIIHFKRDRILINSVQLVEVIAPACHIQAITTHDGNVTINGALTVNGPIHGTGNITSDADIADATGSMGDMRDVHNIHDHYVPTAPGTSNAPNQQM